MPESADAGRDVRLCIPIEYRPEGGMYTFLANFTDYLDRRGIPYTRELAHAYDILFVNSWVVPYETVRKLKARRAHLRVVQRVDGSAQDYGRGGDADERQARVNLLADLTIFQSHFSRASVKTRFKVIHQDGPVIYNPVDTIRFTPDGPREPRQNARPRVVNVAWSTNPLKGAARIGRLAAANPHVDFVLCGRHGPELEAPNVVRLGHVDRERLPVVLRSADLFLNVSENDPCPNVILEALASGLPVLYLASGGVPELVGPCGAAVTEETFAQALDAALHRRPELSRLARARAEEMFAPDNVFPQYLEAIASAVRRPIPSASEVKRLAAQGYPVVSTQRPAGVRVAAAVVRRARRVVDDLVSRARRPVRRASAGAVRVGWITYDSFHPPKRSFRHLDSFTRLRAGNVGEWINANVPSLHNELYRRGDRYDIVVFQKRMDRDSQLEARAIQETGGKVVFDANVNYYEVWGDYFIPGTLPTEEQQRDAIAMTRQADWVVADSSYIAEVARKFTSRVSWIPDSVDMSLYGRCREHAAHTPVRLIWSGVGKKAAHLLLIRDVLAELRHAELMLVTDSRPDCYDQLADAIPCHLLKFSDEAYAAAIQEADIIISPKRLVNAYELGHTEYKIALGMAAGLPAIASPQQSYVDAISYCGGGIIAQTPEEWSEALTRLIESVSERRRIGALAHRTVAEKYSTPVIARQFVALFESLVRRG